MANLLHTGFEGITTAQYTRRFATSTTGGPTIGTAYGRTGQGARVDNGGSQDLIYNIASAPTTIFSGTAIRLVTGADQREIIRLQGGSNVHLTVWYRTATGILELIGPTGTTLGATSAITLNTWLYLELGILALSTTVGAATLKINGTAALTLTGINTKHASSSVIDKVRWGTPNGSGHDLHLDDIYLNDATGSAPDNTFWGPIKTRRVDVTSDVSTQFTKNGGSTNFGRVADGDSPDDATSYNASSTVGHLDRLGVSGYPAPPSTILGATYRVVAFTDTGTRTIQPSVKSGATTVSGTATALTTTPVEIAQLLPTDPATSAAFASETAINALELRYEVTV